MRIEVSDATYARLLELKEKTKTDSLDEIIDWLLDFWSSWNEQIKETQNINLDTEYDS